MNELAEFYLAYAVHFKASKLLRSPAPFSEGKGDGSHDRFLPSFNGSRRATIVECVLCSAQFLHPASSLILAIAKLPPRERTPELSRFVALYSPLIVHEHLIRWMSHSNRNYWRAPDLDSAYLDVWRRLAAPEVAHRHNYKYAVVDTDLWEIAMAAELLAANKTAPEVVPVSAPDRRKLRDIVRVGVAMMRSRMAMHPDTRDFAGSVVGSIGMFEGDFNGYPDVRFAGETNEQLPATPAPLPATLSWDVSHATRIPRVIESLRRAQSSLGFTTFTDDEIRRLANQYLYRVFQGDYAHPRLANFFDGSDGWYRVGYHGPGFGYPPSRFCDSRAGSHPCLETFGVTGWGLLSNTNPELCSLYDALVKLASANDSSSRDYADRYFTFQGEPFARSIGNENGQYPLLLFIILSDNAASLR